MQPFTSHTGIAVPLLQDDINTDQMAPVQAGKRGQEMPLASLNAEVLAACVSRGESERDNAAVIEEIKRRKKPSASA